MSVVSSRLRASSHLRAGGQFPLSPFYLALQSTLVPQRASGSNTPTYTRAAPATQTDWEGKINAVLSGEARFQGARRVANLSSSSNVSAWAGTSNNTVASGISDPSGGTTAYRITATGASAFRYVALTTPASGTKLINSAWIRRVTGSGTIRMYSGADASAAGSALTLTSEWQRFTPGVVTTAGAGNNKLGFLIATSGDEIDVAWPQAENVTGQSNTNPSEYVSVGVLSAPYHGAGVDGVKYFSTLNGNTVSSNVVTEATGLPINPTNGASSLTTDAYGPFGYLAEGARTNYCLQSQDFATSWSNTTSSESTNTTVAPDGTTTADTLLADAGAGVHAISQSLTTSVAANTLSVFMKAGTHNYAQFVIGGSAPANAYANFDIGTGVLGTVGADATATITAFGNGWYRATMTFTPSGTGISVNIYVTQNATSARALSWSAAGTESIILWGAQLEAASFASTYIPTTTASVTRDADVLTYPLVGNLNVTAGTAYAELWTEWSGTATASAYVLNTQSGAGTPMYMSNGGNVTQLYMNDSTTTNSKTGLTSMATAVRKRAASWGASTQSITGDGATPATAAFDGSMGSASGNLYVGSYNTGTANWFGTIRNVNIWQVDLNSAYLQVGTA